MKTTLKVIAATALFAGLHSVLASRRAKRLTTRLIGERNRNGLYRVAYIGQSAISFAALVRYMRQQPDVILYDLKGSSAWPFRATQAVGLALAAVAAGEVGYRRISGIESFSQWQREGEVEPEPEAQGPAVAEHGMQAVGLFRLSRHPLNFWPLLVLWFNPRMTATLAAFNAAATVYLVIGLAHEELRLRAAYGTPYKNYQQSQVPFYMPRLIHLLASSVPSMSGRLAKQIDDA